MDKEVLINVTLDENCEYESSTISQKINVPQQIVSVTLSVSNNEPNRYNNEYYFNDTVKLEATVKQISTNIQKGRIEFYFTSNETNTTKLINKPSGLTKNCKLSKNGSTYVLFKPTSSGTVFAKYIDDDGFYQTQQSEIANITLSPIPVKIEYTHTPEYIDDVHKEINIQVQVTENKNNNSPIKYGTVTFLRYYDKDNTTEIPKVIGNPVPVINGYAEINYIPIQTDDDTEIESTKNNYEYIRASYNYGGKYVDSEKGAYQWKYYDTQSAWTKIRILARNTINILAPNLLSTDDTGIYNCLNNENVQLKAILKDKHNNNITFNNGEHILTFHVDCTHPHPTSSTINLQSKTTSDTNIDDFNFIHTQFDIEATYENGAFIAELEKPLDGFYTITASTDIQEDGDRLYDSVDDSNVIQISSNYPDINYNISLSTDTYKHIEEPLDNIKCIVTNIPQKEMSILNGKRCYFYVSKVNKTYMGTLSYINNSLIGTPDDDISFKSADNYEIRAYIPESIYTTNASVDVYHDESVYDFYLPYRSSLPVTVEIRRSVALDLSVNVLQSTIPASFSYALSSKYPSNQVIAQLIKKPDMGAEEIINNAITLGNDQQEATGTININTAGKYTIYARTDDGESNRETIEISKDSLTQSISDSDKTMFASEHNTIGVYLSCINNNADKININNIKAYIYDENQEHGYEADILTTRTFNNKNTYVDINPKIWKEGTWYIKVTYAGDNNFNEYGGKMERFDSFLATPVIQLRPDNDDYDVFFKNADTNDAIITGVKFLKGNTTLSSGVFISKDGYGQLKNQSFDWWSEWTSVQFTFAPYNIEFINLLKTNETPYQALKTKYHNIFDAEQITQENTFYYQLRYHNNKYVHDFYKPIEMTIARPSQL